MYESPIDIIYNDIQYKVTEEFDKTVVSAVQSYGIDANKEDLLKALQHDRQQYEKGYADAKAEQQWIPCSERLPKDDRYVLITCEWDDVEIGWYDGEWRSEHCVYDDSDIVAWMPLPEPYKGGEQDD